MTEFSIEYRIRLRDGSERSYCLRLHPKSLEQLPEPGYTPPEWTQLGFHQCEHCPLKSDKHPHCPLAVGLVRLVHFCKGLNSHDPVTVQVITPQRRIIHETSAQRAISSLLGLASATSGCPHTVFFKPMARFHLPLANEEETVYRATSMYVLAQYFMQRKGKQVDFDLKGLAGIYQNIRIVNAQMAKRLRSCTDRDAAVNAIVLLDLLAKALPYSIDESLEEIRYLFTPFLATLA